MVLLKGRDERGFVFYTNYESRKARHIDANPQVALLFPWIALGRQVKITGTAAKVPLTESMQYFASRPRGSQLGAWASHQSQPLPSRFALLRRVAALEVRWLGRAVPRPGQPGSANRVRQLPG